jgi:hypothetical protein
MIEKEETGCRISMVKRETYYWHRFIPLKQIIFVSNCFFWQKNFISSVIFFTFKVIEKTQMSSSWFWFFRPCIGLTLFLKVFYRYFWLKMGWKISFFDKKNLGLDFSVITVFYKKIKIYYPLRLRITWPIRCMEVWLWLFSKCFLLGKAFK